MWAIKSPRLSFKFEWRPFADILDTTFSQIHLMDNKYLQEVCHQYIFDRKEVISVNYELYHVKAA